MTGSLERLLARLDIAKRRRPGAREAARLLRSLRGRDFPDAASLIRFHDAVLFLRAYPHSRAVLRLCESILATFPARVERLADSGADLSAFDHPEVSGIAGTTITTDYSYDVVRWLKRRFGRSVTIDWEGYEGDDRLRALLPAFLPLLEEEALEDANVPYRDYLSAVLLRRGSGAQDELSWLLGRIGSLGLPAAEESERYDALGLSVAWRVGGGRANRTRMRRPARSVVFHDEPLISRRDVSLAEQFASPPLSIRRLPRREGAAMIETAREATALRYREYYAFTYGDPGSVLQARVGRGLEITLVGVEADRRLPLRSSYGGFLVKNGVPIGYFEALAFFERMEVGFNLYYAFRDGESAWTFARSLKLLRQALGVTSFSLDPYQIGYENEEAIDSGAFWFYRKLGFRSTDPKLRALTSREEAKIAADPAYRTSSAVLRRMAAHNLLYDAGAASPPEERSERCSSQGAKRALPSRGAKRALSSRGAKRRGICSRLEFTIHNSQFTTLLGPFPCPQYRPGRRGADGAGIRRRRREDPVRRTESRRESPRDRAAADEASGTPGVRGLGARPRLDPGSPAMAEGGTPRGRRDPRGQGRPARVALPAPPAAARAPARRGSRSRFPLIRGGHSFSHPETFAFPVILSDSDGSAPVSHAREAEFSSLCSCGSQGRCGLATIES